MPTKRKRKLEELVIYGLKGVAAYAYHAMMLVQPLPRRTPKSMRF